ncbi:Ig-like domain repeat protein, partial [Bacillus subtilis]|nr:Ig-like domain repeat protein [Bacillus subtilis]
MAKKPVSSSSNSARGEGHAVTKSGNMVYVAIDPSSVVKYVRAGNDLLIHQDNGKVIRIRGFFTAQDTQKLELVYKYDGSEWPVKAIQSTIPLDDETGAEVAFTVAEERSESDNATLLALAALGAAAIGIGTGGSSGGSGGGNGGGGTPEKPAPKSPDLTTKANADGTVTASGLAAAGSSVTVTFPDGSSRVVVAGADGKFSTTSLKPQETGNVTAIVTDANGKSSLPKVVEYIDKVAPGKPDGLSYTDEVGPITGKIAEKGVTDDARPTLSGKAEPNSTITIRDGTTVIGTTKADAQGNWTFRPTTALAEGEHKITFTATDKAKNESAPSAEFVFTVDTVAPPVPAVKAVLDNEKETGDPVALTSGGWTNDATPEFTGEGAEAGTTIYFYDNGNEIGKTVVGTDGKWTFTPAVNLQDGKHSVTMKAVDKAGNTSAASTAFELNVDTVAPNAPSIAQIMDDVGSVTGIIANGKTTDDTQPTLSGSGAEAGSIVKIYDGTTLIGQTTANANGTWTFTPETALAEGTHVFTVTATDKAGNEGASSTPWTIEVDVTPPAATFVPVIINATDDVQPNIGTVAHEGFTNDTTPRLNGKGAEPSGFIRIYEGDKLLGQVQADENGNWTFDVPARSEGSHSFVAKTVDAAGNEGSSSDPFTLTVDTTAPVASDAVITEVKDSAEPHTGNVVHGGLTNDARPVVSGTAVDGIILVRIYDGTTLLGEVEVTGGLWSFTPESDLLNGAHNFRIKAVDAAGNEGPYSPIWSVTVDTLAPNAPVIAQILDDTGTVKGNVADGKTTDAVRPKMSGGSAEAGSTVKIYDKGVLIGETTANANGTWTFTPAEDLAEGEHVFTVTSTDKAGNEGVPSSSWTVTVDTTAPEQPVISRVVDVIGDELTADMISGERRPNLSGEAEAGSVVTIYDNGKKIGTVVAEDDGTWSFEPKANLAQGEHKFTVKATDAAGNSSEVSEAFTFTVDTVAPDRPEITAITDDVGLITGSIKANGVTDDARPVLTGKAEAGSTVTIYDFGEAIGTVTADATGAWSFTPDTDLAEGGHSFSVSATDAAGNVSPASKAFVISVDTVAPDAPQFTTGYDAVGPVIGEFNSGAIINDGRPKLSGSGAEPNAKVTIYQDGVAVATITADAGGQWNWKSDAALSDATYVFTATVTDTAGNVSAPSAGFTVSVDTVAPAAPMIEVITDNVAPVEGNVDKGGFTNDTTPTLSGSGAEANGTVRIYDGATLLGEVKADADGKWTFTPENALGSGVHSFTVVGVDAAGNVSVRSDAYSVTVDTLAPNAPAITQVLDDVGSVQGAVANGKTTDDTKPTISGSGAEGGSIVKIYDGT